MEKDFFSKGVEESEESIKVKLWWLFFMLHTSGKIRSFRWFLSRLCWFSWKHVEKIWTKREKKHIYCLFQRLRDSNIEMTTKKNCLKVPRNHFKSLTYVETLFFCKLVNVRVFNIYHMHELSYLKVKRTSIKVIGKY